MTAQTMTRLFVTVSELTEDDATGYGLTELTSDVDASNQRFVEMLHDALKVEYPEFSISVETEQRDGTRVILDPLPEVDSPIYEDDVREAVNTIATTLYGQGEFWVEAGE